MVRRTGKAALWNHLTEVKARSTTTLDENHIACDFGDDARPLVWLHHRLSLWHAILLREVAFKLFRRGGCDFAKDGNERRTGFGRNGFGLR